MATISSLPKELLFIIFNKLDNLGHLAECRLVCRAWGDPVVRAMLGSMIKIDSRNEAKMHSLYAFLRIDPARAYLIKHLDFFLREDYSRSTVTKELLQLALSSNNIESMTGYVEEINFPMDIVEKFPNKFNKLKTLALTRIISFPFELALHCKKTIQTLNLDYFFTPLRIDWRFMDRLNEFHHLTSFTLNADVGSIRNLDKILDGSPHLREFVLVGGNDVVSIDDVKLNLQDIKRHINMRDFWLIASYNFDDMMQYLLYKFIGVEEIFMKLDGDNSFEGFLLDSSSEQERQEYLGNKKAVVQEILHSLKEGADCMAKIERMGFYVLFRIKIVRK